MEFEEFGLDEKKSKHPEQPMWSKEEVEELRNQWKNEDSKSPSKVVSESSPAKMESSPDSILTDDTVADYPLTRIEFPPDDKYIAGKIARKVQGFLATEEFIKESLEAGRIPIVVDGNIRSVIEDEEGAEELLMAIHEVNKNKGVLEKAIYKDKVIEIINSASDGKLKETLLEFAEIMDYKPEFCEPIVVMESAFYTAMDEVDHYAMSLQKRQISLLSNISETLNKVLLALNPKIIMPEGTVSEEDIKKWNVPGTILKTEKSD